MYAGTEEERDRRPVKNSAAEEALSNYVVQKIVDFGVANDSSEIVVKLAMVGDNDRKTALRFLDNFEGSADDMLHEYREWRDERLEEIAQVAAQNAKMLSEGADKKKLKQLPASPSFSLFVSAWLKRVGKATVQVTISDRDSFIVRDKYTRGTERDPIRMVQVTRPEPIELADGTEIRRSQTYHMVVEAQGLLDVAGMLHV